MHVIYNNKVTDHKNVIYVGNLFIASHADEQITDKKIHDWYVSRAISQMKYRDALDN